ncbi:hypothetical protein JSE7799_03476 [Jannaschia seosinensis]|uniref:DUF4139 domain-containing protein n=1 Tax=Jannaschia seosinensis TaxID=313367 RepID=A0A0M7BEC1_9RHOB|nr:DUF4139 domain-containing protein [Jannaschia seosinensis]CUH40741.1 hypothetical protein JSE7799_03476 [Jannaschia seosinensis]
MRRAFAVTILVLAAAPVAAADFPLAAPAERATIFLQGAEIERIGAIDLPAGDHRLLIPVMPNAQGTPRIDVAGATLGAVETLPEGITDGRRLFTPEQEAARVVWRTAQDDLAAAEDARDRAAAGVEAATASLAFLRSVEGGALAGLDAESVAATADAVADGVAEAQIARTQARDALRLAEDRVEEARFDLRQARRDLDATGADFGPVTLRALSVQVAQAGPVAVTMREFAPMAGWSMTYDANLTAEGVVALTRKARLHQSSGLPLSEVDLTLSTAAPFARAEPSDVPPNRAQIVAPQEGVDLSGTAPELARDMAPMSRAAEMSLATPDPVVASANTDGPVVTYSYPAPVTLPVDGAEVIVSLDRIDLPARVYNRAAPRYDATAFLVAQTRNDTDEPLLPGPVTIYREGVQVAETHLPLLPAGDEADIGFGPQEHLRLEYVLKENRTGDRGLIFTSGTRRQDIVFRVRNLSDAPETVETLYALPFSEEEDLEIALDLDPQPDARGVEDVRGLAMWELEVPAGGEREVEIGVTLEWPEGQELVWQP